MNEKQEKLFNRRRRMLMLLSLNNSITQIAEVLSKDFECSKKAIYTDYERRKKWIPIIEAMEGYATIIHARLDFLDREAIELITGIQNNADATNKFVKIGAINAALKVTSKQMELAQERGWIEKRPIEIIQNNLNMPFACDPEIKRVLLERAAEQREQKELREKQRLENAAENNKVEPDSGR